MYLCQRGSIYYTYNIDITYVLIYTYILYLYLCLQHCNRRQKQQQLMCAFVHTYDICMYMFAHILLNMYVCMYL